MPYVNTKTVAYIFALVIDFFTFIKTPLIPSHFNMRHLFSRHSIPCPLMISLLSGFLTNFYENILKKAWAGGRPVAMPLSGKFVTKAASLPAPDPAACAASDNNNVEVPRADADSAAPPPAPAVAEAAQPPPRSCRVLLRHRRRPRGAFLQRLWQAQDFLIETSLNLHYCD